MELILTNGSGELCGREGGTNNFREIRRIKNASLEFLNGELTTRAANGWEILELSGAVFVGRHIKPLHKNSDLKIPWHQTR
jgi:hypothetical protein